MEPYYIDSRHTMTYCENQGGEWLLRAQAARAAGEWDNVSYYLGIASHYWADITQYFHHDNARSYFENRYGSDTGYQIWDSYHDHLEWQVEYYRPKDPALITPDGTNPYGSLNDFLTAARPQIYEFIDNTMDPDLPTSGWLWDWVETRKCEDSEYPHTGGAHYGSKELVDMATELVYSGWVYALGQGGNVSAEKITWTQWWSREHREPGVVYIGF
jgi:hypothetical protein